MSIPITVGVTGHRDLREKDIPGLRELVRQELERIQTKYPHSTLVMLNSLAAGADLLCAEVAVALGIVLKCPLPIPAEEYRRDFEGKDLNRHEAMLAEAAEVFIAPDTEPVPLETSRDFHYRQAGIYVASHSHVLLALWDGASAKPDGCGTAEAVDFVLNDSYVHESCFKAANDGAVIHIATPRKSADVDFTLTTRLIENEPGSLRDVLSMTDSFNADCQTMISADRGANILLPGIHIEDATLNNLWTVYAKADRLSLRFQQRYMCAIRCFSVFGMLLVLSYLLYDELEANLFLLCYGLLMLAYTMACFLVRKGKFHLKYLQYRILSETLRVQFYLTAADTGTYIVNAFTWTQQQEVTWIKKAVSALLIGAPTENQIPTDAIKMAWIDGQLAYHNKALTRDLHKHLFNEKTARWMLICSVALFAAVLILEYLFSRTMMRSIFMKGFPAIFSRHSDQAFTVRSLMMILLGGISAMTVFLANYYGKLSFERKSIDHKKMVRLFASAKAIYENGQAHTETLFTELAREEIIESGNWFSYCQENTPSFNL